MIKNKTSWHITQEYLEDALQGFPLPLQIHSEPSGFLVGISQWEPREKTGRKEAKEIWMFIPQDPCLWFTVGWLPPLTKDHSSLLVVPSPSPSPSPSFSPNSDNHSLPLTFQAWGVDTCFPAGPGVLYTILFFYFSFVLYRIAVVLLYPADPL